MRKRTGFKYEWKQIYYIETEAGNEADKWKVSLYCYGNRNHPELVGTLSFSSLQEQLDFIDEHADEVFSDWGSFRKGKKAQDLES